MNQRGFTLIEVMIAAAILALMGATVFGSFRQSWTQKEQVEAADDRYAQARTALDRMAADLSLAYLSEHYDRKRYTMRPTLFKARDESGGDELTFTALAHERFTVDQKAGDSVVIKYLVDRVPDAEPPMKALFRRSRAVLDEESERRGIRQILCEHVKDFQLFYWDAQKQEWVDEWDASRPEHNGVLPERVKIELTIEETDGREKKFTTQSRIMIQRSLDF